MKTITKTYKHKDIYQFALNLVDTFNDNTLYLPAAVNFSIQKNKMLCTDIATEIENSRLDILQHYASEQNETGYVVAPQNIESANKELNDLLNMERDLQIYCFSIEEIQNIQLTSAQMQAILFMMDENN